MSAKLLLCLALGLSIPSSSSLGGTLPINSQPQKLVHNWEYITFPRASHDDKQRPDFIFGWPGPSEHSDEIPRGLRLDIMNIVQGFRFFKTNAITARLYRANGQVVEPTAEGKKLLNAPVSISTMSLPDAEPAPQVLTYFPWGTNALEESWIEVTLGAERYWLEIPYGFDRNPTDPLPPSVPGGRPKMATAMKQLTGRDHVVRWQNVRYDVGRTPDGCELSLIQSNPFDAKSDVDLYSDLGARNLYSPHTDVHLRNADGTVINGRCVDLHLDDNHLRRTDTFDIFDRGGDDLRCWGQIEISIDDTSYRVVVPSSIYKYIHGHASTN